MRKPWTRNLKSSCLTGSLLIAGILPFQAHAALGEPEASVATDVQQFQASVKSTLHASYRVHEWGRRNSSVAVARTSRSTRTT